MSLVCLRRGHRRLRGGPPRRDQRRRVFRRGLRSPRVPHVHPDPAWVDAANRVRTSPCRATSSSDSTPTAACTTRRPRPERPVRVRIVHPRGGGAKRPHPPHDFERGGIHLDVGTRVGVERASADALRAAMVSNPNHRPDHPALGVARVPRSRLAGLPTTILGRLTGDATTATVPLDHTRSRRAFDGSMFEDARCPTAAAHAGPEAQRRRVTTSAHLARAEVAEGGRGIVQSHAEFVTASRRSSRDTRTPRAGCCARWRSEPKTRRAKRTPSPGDSSPRRRDAAMDARAIPRRSPRFPAIPTPIPSIPRIVTRRSARGIARTRWVALRTATCGVDAAAVVVFSLSVDHSRRRRARLARLRCDGGGGTSR